MLIEENSVVTMDFQLFAEDGRLVDNRLDYEFIQGIDDVLVGMRSHLKGAKVGDCIQGTVPAEEALNRNGDPTLGVNALTLKTHDIEASGNFYEALGFVVEYSQLLPPWKTLSIGHRQHLNLQGVNATDPFLTNGSPVWGRPVIYVKSVDEVYARAMANGFLPEFPPSNAAWGERFLGRG